MKKILLILMAVNLIFGCQKDPEITVVIKTPSSKENPILISSVEDLIAFRKEVNSGTSYENEFIKLAKDLDLEGSDESQWTPIGHYSGSDEGENFPFKGEFDGNGKTISGLHIDSIDPYQSLFGYIDGATVLNCSVDGSVDALQYNGGLVGYASNSTIKNCYSSGEIKASVGYAAGIVGRANNTTFINCHNNASISGTTYLGGIVGCDDENSIIVNCYNTSNISGTGEIIGGLAGKITTIVNCYNTGSVSGSGNVGGTAGEATTLTNCYSLSGCVSSGSGGQDGEQKKEIEMKMSSFVVDLNNNVYEYNLTSPSETACAWVGVDNNYPTLDYDQSINSLAEKSAILIYYVEDLITFRENVNSGVSYEGETVKLMKSLDLEGNNENQWTAIGYYNSSSDNNIFKGTFDGNGNTISGLYIDTSLYHQGLFGYAEDCEISNLTVEGEVLGYSISVGAIVGWMNNGKISNCSANATINCYQGGGGIVGQANNSTIVNCYNTGNVSGGENTGGVAGYGLNSSLTNCYNTGTVNGGIKTGGVAGTATTLTNCYNTGAVSGEDTTGGVAGNEATLTNCYSLSGCVTSSSEIKGQDGTTMSKEEMQSSSFVATLNANASDYNLANQGAELCAWMKTSSYPILAYDLKPDAYVDYDLIYSGGSCLIFSAKGLHAFRDLVNGNENTTGAIVNLANSTISFGEPNSSLKGELADNINLEGNSENQWTAIGYYNSSSDNAPFKGTFDGNGNTISGLYINKSAHFQGLFGYAEDCEISNLTVKGEILGNSISVGAIVGEMLNSKISNCSANATISCRQQGGGIVGQANNSTIVNCYNTGNVSGGENTGGVAGTGVETTLVNCYNTGNVSGAINTGGVAGTGAKTPLVNCYNTGDVSGGNFTGGVAGTGIETTLVNCYNTAAVSGGENTGGVAGTATTLTNCYSLSGCVTSSSEIKGQDGTTMSKEEMQSSSFVTTLNANASNYNSVNSGAGLCAWEKTTSYPILAYDLKPDAYVDYDLIYSGGTCLIYSAKGLHAFRDLVNGNENTTGAIVNLANSTISFGEANSSLKAELYDNINLEGGEANQWSPIGYYSGSIEGENIPFKGEFNGNGLTISGLYISSNLFYQGLFGYIEEGRVENLNIAGQILGSTYFSGALAGYCNGAEIDNCSTNATISGLQFTGGLVGLAVNNSTIAHCYNTGSVTTSNGAAAGIVAQINNSTVINCYNKASVTGDTYVGGIVGLGTDDALTINCYNSGKVESWQIAGGIAGQMPTIENCYNSGEVSGSSTVGGVSGSSTSINNCFSLEGCVTEGAGGQDGDKKTEYELKSLLVVELHNNAYDYNLSCSGIKACSWVAETNDYPTLDFNSEATAEMADVDLVYSEGSCLIYSTKGLHAFRDLVNGNENTSGANVHNNSSSPLNFGESNTSLNAVQQDNITLTGEWSPIGSSTIDFTGKYNGAGFSIKGLSITSDESACKGLFASIGSGGRVENVAIKTGGINCSTNYVGAIAGYNSGEIYSCYSAINVKGEANTGGLVGVNEGTIQACYSHGSVQGTNKVGGITGLHTQGKIQSTFSLCDVSGDSFVAGIAGSYSWGTIDACYTTYNSGLLYNEMDASPTYNNSYTSILEYKSTALYSELNSVLSQDAWEFGFTYPQLINNVEFEDSIGTLN